MLIGPIGLIGLIGQICFYQLAKGFAAVFEVFEGVVGGGSGRKETDTAGGGDRVISKMKELDLLTKLSKYQGDSKFKSKIRLFLLSPKIYYKTWKKLKNSID